MTLRDVLDGLDPDVHARLDQVLDSEDAVVVLADARGITTYVHGFAASGCQLEMVASDVDAVVRALGSARG
jgi:hypothetical protein